MTLINDLKVKRSLRHFHMHLFLYKKALVKCVIFLRIYLIIIPLPDSGQYQLVNTIK